MKTFIIDAIRKTESTLYLKPKEKTKDIPKCFFWAFGECRIIFVHELSVEMETADSYVSKVAR